MGDVVLFWGNPHKFVAFSHQHLLVLGSVAAVCGAVAVIGRRASDDQRERAEPVFGVVLLAIWCIGAMWDWASATASSRNALPLHWCDLTGILAGVVMLNPTRATRAALHFWGICFSSIAFIAPVETTGPFHADFWIYFGSHAAILAAVVYDRAARRYVPTRQDFYAVAVATAAWVAAVTPFNVLLGANYAYVGFTTTHQRAIVNAFGEWPGRLIPLYLCSIGLMAIVLITQHAVRSWQRATPRTMRITAGEERCERPAIRAAA
jgi:hypothetical integral membrane protein (TIGR02206 family)